MKILLALAACAAAAYLAGRRDAESEANRRINRTQAIADDWRRCYFQVADQRNELYEAWFLLYRDKRRELDAERAAICGDEAFDFHSIEHIDATERD